MPSKMARSDLMLPMSRSLTSSPHGYLGRDLISPEQIVELMMQDVIIPRDSAKHLVNAAKYIDEELVKLYDLEPFYGLSSLDGLFGHFIVGLAPHTSVGIVGRIIGFADSQVCFASPILQ